MTRKEAIKSLYSDIAVAFENDGHTRPAPDDLYGYDFCITQGARPANYVLDNEEKLWKSIKAIIIGEAPGKDEVLAGLPFQWKAGHNLRANIPDEQIQNMWITNVVKFRPVRKNVITAKNWSNCTPKPRAIRFFAPYLLQEIRIISADLPILLVGQTALAGVVHALLAQENIDTDTQKSLQKILKTPASQRVNSWIHLPFDDGVLRCFLIYHTSPLTYSGRRETKHTASIQDGIQIFLSSWDKTWKN